MLKLVNEFDRNGGDRPSAVLRSILLACTSFAILFVVSGSQAMGATITSNQTGNWSATTTWVGGVVPVAADSVVIAAGHTVTLTANTTITGVTVNATGVLATVTFTLGVSGNLVVNGTITGTGAITLSGAGTNIDGAGSITNTGILTINAAHTILPTANPSFAGRIAITGAITVTNNGTVTTTAATGITGSVAGSSWTQGTTGTLNIIGPMLATGTLDASANGNTLNYNGAAQAVKATATYHHLLLGGSGAKTLNATTTAINGDLTTSGTATTALVVGLTISGNLNLGTGTTLTAGAFALTVTGTTSVTGTLTISSATGTKAFNGDVTVNSGGIWNNTAANVALTLPGNLSNAGTFNAGTGVYTFSGSSKTISGTISIPRVTVSGTYQNNGALTVATALAGAGTLTNGGAATLNINFTGAVGLANLTATASGNIVNYGFAGAQTILATTYHHLNLSTSGAKTAGGALTVNGDFTTAGTATFAAGTSLTHTFLGNWVINSTAAAPFSFTTASTINFNPPGTPAATSLTGTTVATIGFNTVNLNNTSGFSSTENFSITGTLTVAANVTFTPAAAAIVSGAGTLTGSGTVKVTRIAATPDFNSQYSITTKTLTNLTVDYDAAAAQTVNALNYFNLTISNNRGGAAVTLAAGTVGISGTFAPNAANVSYTTAGNTVNYNGTIAQTVVAFNYNNLTSSSTGARSLANSGTIGVAGTFTPGANSYTITGSTIDFNGAVAQTIPAFNYNNLTISGSRAATNVTLANSGTIGVAGTLSDTAAFNAGSGFITTGSTVDYNGTGSQTVTALSPLVAGNSTYNNLTVSNTASPVSAGTSFSVGGTFTDNANAIFSPASAVVISGGGTLTGSGTVQVTLATGSTVFASQYTITNKTLTSLTIEFTGASAQGTGAVTFGGLKINNSNGVTLSGNATVNGTLTFTSGNINTGANRVIISSTGTVSRTSGYVFGNLQKYVATGATSVTFEVGDASNYAPVNVSFASVTSAGDLTVNTTAGDHPNIAGSTINSAKSVNRYWTLTNSGIVFTTYSATFNFVSGDVDAGTDTNAFAIGKFASAVWAYPTVGSKTANSTQATGLAAFGDFQLGESTPPNVALVRSVSPLGSQPPDTDLNYTVTFTNSGGVSAQSVVIADPNPTDVIPAQRVFVYLDYKLGTAAISSPWVATIEFSNDGGATWTYTPVSAGGGAPSGYDRSVTNIRWSITGSLATSASGNVSFTSRIQ